eukprot:EG_transcript_9863
MDPYAYPAPPPYEWGFRQSAPPPPPPPAPPSVGDRYESSGRQWRAPDASWGGQADSAWEPEVPRHPRPRDEEEDPAAKRQRVTEQVSAFRDRGTAAFSAGDNWQAVELWSQGLELDPANAALYSNRCAAYLALEQHEKALADATRCVELAPQWCKGYYRKAKVCMAMRNLAAAMTACRKGLELTPDDVQLKALEHNLKPQAVKEMEECKAEGNKAFGAKDYTTAISWYQKALQFDKDNHVLYSNRSACHCALGQYDAALKDAARCIKLNKFFAKGYSRKAAALHGLGRKVEALQTYRQGLAAVPGNVMLTESLAALQDQVHGKAPEAPKKVYQPMCRECFQEGHLARDCPKRGKGGAGAPPANRCANCGDPGHGERDCPLPKQVYCKGCGGAGHLLQDCLQPSSKAMREAQARAQAEAAL